MRGSSAARRPGTPAARWKVARQKGKPSRAPLAAAAGAARKPRPDGSLRQRRRWTLVGEGTSRASENATSGGESRFALDAQLGSAALRGGKHTENIFRGDKIAVLARTYGVVVVHRSRHARSFLSPRLIQLFMVPSGTSDLRASSS